MRHRQCALSTIPNVLPLYTSFVHGQDLWMVTPFMSGGSIPCIMKYQYPDVSKTEGSRQAMLVKPESASRQLRERLMSCKCRSAVSRRQIQTQGLGLSVPANLVRLVAWLKRVLAAMRAGA